MANSADPALLADTCLSEHLGSLQWLRSGVSFLNFYIILVITWLCFKCDNNLSRLMRLWHFSSSVNSFLQTHMCRHPVGLDVWYFVGHIVYFHTLCVRTAKALARLHSPEPSLVAYMISTIITGWLISCSSFQWHCSMSIYDLTKTSERVCEQQQLWSHSDHINIILFYVFTLCINILS